MPISPLSTIHIQRLQSLTAGPLTLQVVQEALLLLKLVEQDLLAAVVLHLDKQALATLNGLVSSEPKNS
jgi:hypothetical protein